MKSRLLFKKHVVLAEDRVFYFEMAAATGLALAIILLS